jgi:hypothetical protein
MCSPTPDSGLDSKADAPLEASSDALETSDEGILDATSNDAFNVDAVYGGPPPRGLSPPSDAGGGG